MFSSNLQKIELLKLVNDNLNSLEERITNQLNLLNKNISSNDLLMIDIKETISEKIKDFNDSMLGNTEKLTTMVNVNNSLLKSINEKKRNCYIINHKLEAHQFNDMRTLKIDVDYDSKDEEIKFTVLANKIKIETYRFQLMALMNKYGEMSKTTEEKENLDRIELILKALGNFRVLLRKSKKDENLISHLQFRSLKLLLMVSMEEVIVDSNIAMEIFEQTISNIAISYLVKTEEHEIEENAKSDLNESKKTDNNVSEELEKHVETEENKL